MISGANHPRNQQINDNNRVKGSHSAYASFPGKASGESKLAMQEFCSLSVDKAKREGNLCRPSVTHDGYWRN